MSRTVTEQRSGRTILVVDDEPSVRRLVEKILVAHGFAVLAAPSGRVARRILEGSSALDLAIVDLALADGPGEEVLSAARRCRPGLPLVVMSGYGERADQVTREGKADVVLPKPFDPGQLVDAVLSSLQED
ncbi:MAG: response regulator [Acidobacteriota bacterium]|nr:MAG: response regulator [Acidobacteriota bacterium]